MWGMKWFYWCGVVFNVLFGGGLLIGIGGSLWWYLKDWKEDIQFWKEREKKARITMAVDNDDAKKESVEKE